MSEKEELRGFLPQAQDDLSEPVDPGSEQNSEPADLSGPTLSVQAVMAPKLSLADFQNAVPLIRDLAVVSTLTEDTGQLELSLSSAPAFVKPKTWRLDAVRSGETYRIRDVDVQLDGPLLTRLTEAEVATVTLSLRAVGNNGDTLAETTANVELLPRNQWGGLSHLPDMVAAFVQPRFLQSGGCSELRRV